MGGQKICSLVRRNYLSVEIVKNNCQPLKLFVIHRFKEKRQANRTLKRLARDLSIEIQPVFLDSSGDVEWKQKATEAIRTSEAVIIFNPEACEESFNAKWEVERAKEAGKKIIQINSSAENRSSISTLRSMYELNEEFEGCFSSSSKEFVMELYKLMIDSSESFGLPQVSRTDD